MLAAVLAAVAGVVGAGGLVVVAAADRPVAGRDPPDSALVRLRPLTLLVNDPASLCFNLDP